MRSATMHGPWPRSILGISAFAGLALASSGALADATITVTAQIDDSCVLETTEIDIDFGFYEDATITKEASFIYNCTAGRNLTFTLPAGAGGNTRTLPNVTVGGPPLLYEIFDPDDNPWPSDYQRVSVNSGETLTFEAVMAASQLATGVLPGTFTDQLTLTMSVGP